MKETTNLKLQANIWKLYIIQILSAFAFFAPIIVLFWQDNGLTLTQIMILQSLFSITVVLLEVPSGYFADVFGRKKSLVIAGLFFSAGIITYSIGSNFFHFLAAEMLWAFGISFMSGADSALLYDTLVNLDQESNFKKIWGNIIFYRLLGVSCASIIGGFIGQINFRYTFYLMIPFMFLISLIALTIKEPSRHKMIVKKGYLSEIFMILKETFLHNVQLRWIIIYAAVVYSFTQAVLWFYQPYFRLTGLDIAYFGLAFAAFNIVAAISSKYAHTLENKLGLKQSLIILVPLLSLSYFLMSYFLYVFSFVFAFLQQFVRGFSRPIIADYINKLTDSSTRATVLSAQSLVGKLFYAFIIPIAGWIADIYTIVQALEIIGISALIIGTTILYILHKDKVI